MEMKFPFEIGETWYLPEWNAQSTYVVCPVCCGHKYVWMRNIEGTEFEVACDACGLGFEGPRGAIQGYTYEPVVTTFVIASIDRFDGDGDVVLRATTGRIASLKQLHKDHASALVKATESMAALIESNMRTGEGRTSYHRKHATWPVRYHNEQIEDHQRRIEWHKSKLNGKPKTKKGGRYVDPCPADK